MNEMAKMIIVLTAICLASAFALTALNNGLEARIAQQEEFYVRGPAVHDIFPDAPNDPVADAFSVEVDGQSWRLYPWIENGECRAVALQAAGAGGYGGDVMVMTGIDFSAGRILGARVAQHGETPGIGTRVADPLYMRIYQGVPVRAGTVIALKSAGGEIEGVSGATRTSAAVANGVDRAVQFVLAHKDEIPGWVREQTGR
ncbi:MAG: FMN-binding protein [Candidatus Eisenbacteria sp.]|nr:FMN-binding protein [Candidatus Eisenbacteria bacterium]